MSAFGENGTVKLSRGQWEHRHTRQGGGEHGPLLTKVGGEEGTEKIKQKECGNNANYVAKTKRRTTEITHKKKKKEGTQKRVGMRKRDTLCGVR